MESTNIDVSSRILYKSAACIVVNKLKGEAVEGARGGIESLPEKLKTFLDSGFVEAVHRLDVPVTGCVLFALEKPALVYLNDVFAGRNKMRVQKHYWAIVEKPSHILPERARLVHQIETNLRLNKSFAYSEHAPGRKKASLKYRVTGEGKNYLFLEVELLSGRHHQIRAQLAAAGLHIKGDLKYGARRSEKDGGIRLHARALSFPDNGEIICITAQPPLMDNLWKDFINQLSIAALPAEYGAQTD